MKPNIIPASQNSLRETPRLLDQLARRAVLGKLDKMTHGQLQIIDQDCIHEFGNAEHNSLKAVITVRSPAFYSAVAFGGSVGAGEAYFQGDWDCDNLTSLVRLLLLNRHVLDNMDEGLSRISAPVNQFFHWLHRNTRKGSRRNIAAHYDIGNDMFKLMLDNTMMYSSAIYTDESCTLEQASINKLDRICQKLQLNEHDHVLEIGTGWGGFALHAARHYGCRVTTTTLSREQFAYARQRIQEEGLQDKITLLMQDYRDLSGQYDKLVSIEMIEAVGLNNLGTYFNQCSRLLKANGMMCLQAITIADQRYEQARREVDFIQKYIFPGGSLPSVTAMSQAIMKYTDMRLFHMEDIGPHYARTLRDWRERFFQHEQQIRALGYNDVFIRLWEFYLCYCEGGFLERAIGTVQLLLTKPECRRHSLTPQLTG
ncbi:MAG: class I SAM-dependent methyltransferase [Gammaproteobacteria bacterium]|nr:MAG: class I SAM-dependent methyltransferase [Gammaproteobacteria bacterium]